MSRRSVISSTAMICGFIARRSIGIASAFGQPSSTSVCAPTSICACPPVITATSLRSSIKATRCAGKVSPPVERSRTRSRRSVVFPPPGGERISVLQNPPPRKSRGAISRAIPFRSQEMRSAAEEIRVRLLTTPSFITALPQTPRRKPPRTGRYP